MNQLPTALQGLIVGVLVLAVLGVFGYGVARTYIAVENNERFWKVLWTVIAVVVIGGILYGLWTGTIQQAFRGKAR